MSAGSALPDGEQLRGRVEQAARDFEAISPAADLAGAAKAGRRLAHVLSAALDADAAGAADAGAAGPAGAGR